MSSVSAGLTGQIIFPAQVAKILGGVKGWTVGVQNQYVSEDAGGRLAASCRLASATRRIWPMNIYITLLINQPRLRCGGTVSPSTHGLLLA